MGELLSLFGVGEPAAHPAVCEVRSVAGQASKKMLHVAVDLFADLQAVVVAEIGWSSGSEVRLGDRRIGDGVAITQQDADADQRGNQRVQPVTGDARGSRKRPTSPAPWDTWPNSPRSSAENRALEAMNP